MSLLRCRPWSKYLQTKGSTVTANEHKPMHVSDDREFEAAVGQITHSWRRNTAGQMAGLTGT